MVGLIPLFAVQTMEPEDLDGRTGFISRMQWFLDHHPDVARPRGLTSMHRTKACADLIALVNKQRLVRVLRYMLDENEFLSPYGIRSLSKFHRRTSL